MAELIDPPSILAAKTHEAPSVFQPENLLREARRQRGLPDVAVPAVCVLIRTATSCGHCARLAGVAVPQGGPATTPRWT